MELRVTPQTLANRVISGARQHSDALAVLQQQAATGNRLLKPSDAPLDTMSLLANQAQNLRLDSYLTNITGATASLNVSVSALQEAGNVLNDARQVALQGANAGNDANSYEVLAQQVDALLGRLQDVANTQNAGHYVFAGTATQTAPFVVTSRDGQGRVQGVAYKGSEQSVQVTVGQQQTLATLYAGDQIFQQRQRGQTVISGSTGAAAGTGTDSATGEGNLVVAHTLTTYTAGSGVQVGTGSPASDTIIGPAGAHHLTIVDTSGTGAVGTVSLNDGPAIAFTNADTNLQVTGPNGESVFVNTTAIAAGFNGNVDITADGTLSVDGGASAAPIDFSANQVVTNSTTGDVTNIASANIRSTGTDHLEYTGTDDAFQILMALRDDLRNTRGLTNDQQNQAISQRVGELDRVRSGILNVVGEQSESLQNLQGLQNRVQDVQLETQKHIGDLQSADISQVVINLQSQQNLLQLTLASASKIMDLSLLDFLK